MCPSKRYIFQWFTKYTIGLRDIYSYSIIKSRSLAISGQLHSIEPMKSICFERIKSSFVINMLLIIQIYFTRTERNIWYPGSRAWKWRHWNEGGRIFQSIPWDTQYTNVYAANRFIGIKKRRTTFWCQSRSLLLPLKPAQNH